MKHTITLPGNTPSLKNSKRIVKAGSRYRLIPSAAYERWAEPLRWHLKQLKQLKLRDRDWLYPVIINFRFYRRDRRRFDLINVAQGPLDLLVEAGILADDDMLHVIPGKMWWGVDKDNPRVEMEIIE